MTTTEAATAKTINVMPLPYRDCSNQDNTIVTVVIIGIILYVAYATFVAPNGSGLFPTPQQQSYYVFSPNSGSATSGAGANGGGGAAAAKEGIATISAALAHFVKPVLNAFGTVGTSARRALSSSLGDGGKRCIQDAKDAFNVFPPKRVVLIGAGTEPRSESEKDACHVQARRWIAKSSKRAVVMIYSPHCKHCHDTMPVLANKLQGTDVPVLLINADAMPRAALVGAKAIHNVEYYPTFLVKRGGGGGPLERVPDVHAAFADKNDASTTNDGEGSTSDFMSSLF